MFLVRKSLCSGIASAILSALALSGAAQGPAAANDEVLKLIKAGMPETVIIDRIHASTGRLDLSAEALIALKQAGATDAELKAMTESSAIPSPAVAQPQIAVAGGVLRRTPAGDPYIQFPEPSTTIFPNGDLSNRAFLVSYEGRPAIRIPAEHISVPNISGNLILTDSTVLFNPYLVEFGWGEYPKNGKYQMPKDPSKAAANAEFSMPRSAVSLHYEDLLNTSVFSMHDAYPSTRATEFIKGHKAYNVGFHYAGIGKPIQCIDSASCLSPQLEAYVRDLVRDFNTTIAPLLTAAGIQDVDKQLSPAAHYSLIKLEDFPRYAIVYQAQLDKMPPPTKGGGGGFMQGLVGAMAVASAGANVLQAQQSGNLAAQINAQQAYTQTTAQALNGDSAGAVATATNAAASTPQVQPAAMPAAVAPSPTTQTRQPTVKTFTDPLPDGDLRKQTVITDPSGLSHITIECFAPGQNQPYQVNKVDTTAQFSLQQIPCNHPASTQKPPSNPSTGIVKPPVPYTPPPSTGGTVVATNSNLCPANGWIMVQTGDVAIGHQCTPGQPVSSAYGQNNSSGNAAGNSSSSSQTSSKPTNGSSNGDIINGGFCTGVMSQWVARQDSPRQDLWLNSLCAETTSVLWFVGNGAGHLSAIAGFSKHPTGDSFGPGESSHVSVYICPMDHPVAIKADGTQISGPDQRYSCKKGIAPPSIW